MVYRHTLTVAGPALLLAFVLYAGLQSPIKSDAAASTLMHLQIPTIKVDTGIENAGLTTTGEMAVPKGPVDAAWFDQGPRPGEVGSAVIAGHSGWKDNIPAVFDNLYKLRKGDKVYVSDGKGVTTTFVVREIRTYDPKADATGVFSSHDGKVHLNLITCAGTWDTVLKSSSERLVVFTDKE